MRYNRIPKTRKKTPKNVLLLYNLFYEKVNPYFLVIYLVCIYKIMFMWSANCIAYHVHAKILYSQDCKLCALLKDFKHQEKWFMQ